jgi:hypothetical protein
VRITISIRARSVCPIATHKVTPEEVEQLSADHEMDIDYDRHWRRRAMRSVFASRVSSGILKFVLRRV